MERWGRGTKAAGRATGTRRKRTSRNEGFCGRRVHRSRRGFPERLQATELEEKVPSMHGNSLKQGGVSGGNKDSRSYRNSGNKR